MTLIKCPYCGKRVPATRLKCLSCGKPVRDKARIWTRLGVSGICYGALIIIGIYLIATENIWGWLIIVLGVLLLGLRLLRFMAPNK